MKTNEGSGENVNSRLPRSFFVNHDALFLAQALIGKTLVRRFEDGHMMRSRITETEAYLGVEDLANHASKGRTPRTAVMYEAGGQVYVYLIYGIHWLFNIVTGSEESPQAVLIRGLEHCSGPGRVGKRLKIDRSFYGESLDTSDRIWIEDSSISGEIKATTRVGVDFAGPLWKNKPWRFVLNSSQKPL